MREEAKKFMSKYKIDILYYTIFAIFVIYAYIIFPPNIWEKMTDFEKGTGAEIGIFFNWLLLFGSIVFFSLINGIWNALTQFKKKPDIVINLLILFKYLFFIFMLLSYIMIADTGLNMWIFYNPYIITPIIIYILYLMKWFWGKFFILLLLIIPLLLITYNNFYNTINMP